MKNSSPDLTKKKCVPCEGGIPALKKKEIENYLSQLQGGWKLTNDKMISKVFSFVNFKHTMDFVNKVADISEQEEHHPVLHVHFAKLVIEIWTHAIDGLSENDFILAAKIDAL